MNWRGALFDDMGFKLAALVVVTMLWISVTADERQTWPVPTAVDVQVRDSTWVLVERPAEVTTTFQGLNRQLLGLLMEQPVLEVVVDSVTDQQMQVQLQVEQLRYDRDLGVVPSFITPAVMDLRFERRRIARVPVAATVDAVPAAGYTVVTPIQVEPESVTVHGPASWVEGLTRIPTQAVELEQLRNTVIRDVPIVVPDDVPGVGVDPTTVLVTVTIDSLIVRQRRLPLRPIGAGASAARVVPDSVTVSVRGAAKAVTARIAELDSVTVEVAEPPASPYAVALTVDSGDDDAAALRIEPATATVRPRQ